MKRPSAVLFALSIILSGTPAFAQGSPGPTATPITTTIPDARDVPYPGTIKLTVDVSDIRQSIFRVREVIPITGTGPVTLLYPKWLPGSHGPNGPIDKLAGLTVAASGQSVEWRRDPVDVYAFHLQPPAGVTELEVTFQFLSPTARAQGRIVATPDMLDLQWNAVALYPAGYYVRQIQIEPTVVLPAGWKFASALDGAERKDDRITFKPTNFETLVDSPLAAGRHYRQVILDANSRSPVRLNIFADDREKLEIKPEKIAAYKNLVREADTLFGARHYDHYDFLLWLSDHLGRIGLEHHRSSENGARPNFFEGNLGVDLLPHEYTHSWNGKFRRGADLWTPDYRTPMRNSLLWVYEGQTQYWGQVLAARSGLLGKQQTLDALALTAATYEARIGRSWRPLIDTTYDPITLGRRSEAWRSWQRAEDYYSEGQLLWLDIDTLLRERSDGRKSLDDFAKAFFGIDDGVWTPKTYTFDDVVSALNAIVPNDWSSFLKTRLEGHGPAPLDGLKRGGYRLVYEEQPNDLQKEIESADKNADFSFSLGVTVTSSGELSAVQWDGPAFRAGLAVGDKLIAVQGRAYTPQLLRTAITEAKTDNAPIELLVNSDDRFRTIAIDYRGGLRFPRLQRIEGTPARLDAILKPRNPA